MLCTVCSEQRSSSEKGFGDLDGVEGMVDRNRTGLNEQWTSLGIHMAYVVWKGTYVVSFFRLPFRAEYKLMLVSVVLQSRNAGVMFLELETVKNYNQKTFLQFL